MKNKRYFKLLALLLVVTMLTACGKSSGSDSSEVRNFLVEMGWMVSNVEEPTTNEPATEEPTTKEPVAVEPDEPVINTEYDFSIYDDEVSYTTEQLEEQEEFSQFLSDLFKESLESSYLNLLYTVENPENFGLSCDVITWGDYSLETMMSAEQENLELYNELTAFDYDSLDYEGKLIYDTLLASIEDEKTGCKYWYFTEYLSPLDGLQTSLPILLAEIEFNDTEDIDNYIALVNDTKNCIEDILAIEKYRSETYGIFLNDDGADEVIAQCEDFINAEENLLITTFDARIDEFDGLTEEEKADYKSKNLTAVTDNVIAPFNSIIDTMTALKGTRKYDSLSEYEHGEEYYSYIVKCNSGYRDSLEDVLSLTEEYMDDAINAFSTASTMDIYAIYDPEYPVSDPADTLEYFIEQLKQDFPAAVSEEFDIKYVPESLESSSSPAFYIIPPIDNIDKNIIYLNGSDEYANENLYAILAHEGYPGHLYQNTYFRSLNPDPIRSVFSFSGYNEGYAMYTERYAYDYSGLSEGAADLLKANDVFGYGLYSYIDLSVNYSGWSFEDVCTYMEEQGYNSEIATELYNIAVNDPCVYHRYFLGLVGMLELQKDAKELLDDSYSNINFNKFILEIGPTYFDIIEERMIAWAEKLN